ncbi:MAG: hypothetical protein II134_05735 [Lachnospiraceae bacterium]|nr:hypothetical protein [Lachnospiraceae bacterium]
MRRILLIISTVMLLLCGCVNRKPTEAQTATVTPTPTEEPKPAQWSYTPDPNVRYQTMDGFGAGFTWYADWVPGKPYEQAIYDLLFRDCGLSILRFKCEYGYTNFERSASVNKAYYDAAKQYADKRGETMKVLYSSWSPVSSLKSNHVINGGGSLKKNEDGAYDYEGFAGWWTDAVKAYREKGIPVDYVSIQNECDFQASYDGCEFAEKETDRLASYPTAFLSVYRSFRENLGDKTPMMIAPETMTCDATTLRMLLNPILKEENDSVYAVGHHLYLGGSSSDDPDFCGYESFQSNLERIELFCRQTGFKAWQTEFYRGTSLQTANMILKCLTVENASAYIYWGGVWEGGKKSNMETNNMIVVANSDKNKPTSVGYLCTGDYYAMRHYSEFIRPDYVRVDGPLTMIDRTIGTNLRTASFVSPDGNRIVCVLINNMDDEMRIDMTNVSFPKLVTAKQSVFTEGFTADMMYNNVKPVPGTQAMLLLPPSSVTTVVMEK